MKTVQQTNEFFMKLSELCLKYQVGMNFQLFENDSDKKIVGICGYKEEDEQYAKFTYVQEKDDMISTTVPIKPESILFLCFGNKKLQRKYTPNQKEMVKDG